MKFPEREALDVRIHAIYERWLERLPGSWGEKLRTATGGRFGIATQIWIGLGGGVLLTLAASFLALGLMAVVNASQRQVTGTYMPELTTASAVSRSSAELVRASPRLIAATTPQDLALVEADIVRAEELLRTQMGALQGRSLEGEMQDSLVRMASGLIEGIGLIRESIGRRMTYRARVRDLERRFQDVTLSTELIIESELDDQEFFMATGLRELNDPTVPASLRNTPEELRHHQGLVDYQALQNVFSVLIQRALSQDDMGLLQAGRERVLAAIRDQEAALADLKPSAQARLRPSLDELNDLYSASNGIYTIRTLELEELAQSEELLERDEALADALAALVQLLVDGAETSARRAAGRSSALLQLGWWMILVVNVFAVATAVFGGWKYFGERLLVRVRHLSNAMRQMSKGELNVSVDIVGNDEVTDMANALEVFRQHAIEAQRVNMVERLATEVQSQNEKLEATLEELQRTQEQIITQEKLASLGALTAGVAHEIRNPLNFVNNFAALSVELIDELREELGIEGEGGNDASTVTSGPLEAYGDEELAEIVDEILGDLQLNITKVKEHGDRANRIVNGMLAHSRGEAGHSEMLDINLLLEEYTKLAYHGMRGTDSTFNVTIYRDMDPQAGKIKGVARDLSRVILNIVTNACQATQMRGQVEDRSYSPVVRVSTQASPESVCVRVRDNGTGIPDDIRRKIFDPFFTTKSGTQGTGLGLSISHDIVREHGGQLLVESEENEYTEFSIVLPRDATV